MSNMNSKNNNTNTRKNSNNKSNKAKLNSQKGFIGILIVLVTIVVFSLFAFGLLLMMLPTPATTPDLGGTPNNKETHNKPVNEETHNTAKDNNTHQPYKLPEDVQDLSPGYLVCVNFPGVNLPRTSALDARVARRWLAVKQDLDAQGIPTVRATWLLRTNCQQRNVKPSGHNPKAPPGTSPHEAGRAIDVVGMDPSSAALRKDRFQIIATFEKHGFKWKGKGDPPHFDVDPASAGEKSNYHWIVKTQADYKAGNPKTGCRGPECGS